MLAGACGIGVGLAVPTAPIGAELTVAKPGLALSRARAPDVKAKFRDWLLFSKARYDVYGVTIP